jgi:hypothetical protein
MANPLRISGQVEVTTRGRWYAKTGRLNCQYRPPVKHLPGSLTCPPPTGVPHKQRQPCADRRRYTALKGGPEAGPHSHASACSKPSQVLARSAHWTRSRAAAPARGGVHEGRGGHPRLAQVCIRPAWIGRKWCGLARRWWRRQRGQRGCGGRVRRGHPRGH